MSLLSNPLHAVQPKQQSKPHTLTHCDTLSLGTTQFSLHIHAGWDTCEWCRWEERSRMEGEGAGSGGGAKSGTTKGQWKKELNRIRKRYGLRVSC